METIATSGMLLGPFSSGRAVVPMTSYYEWVEADDGGKGPCVIRHPEGKLLHAAGLNAASKAEDATFTTITWEPRDARGEVHDCMRLFLTEDAVGEWLAPGKLELEQQDSLIAMIDDASTTVAGELETYAVDRRVNNVRTLDRTDPLLLEPWSRLEG